MVPRVLECAACALRVEGTFRGNEFAQLEDDYLQLLRVFVLCEGRIRDMEKALGISYPTVKARLAALRARLGLDGERYAAASASNTEDAAAGDDDGEATGARAVSSAPGRTAQAQRAASGVLDALENGAIDHAEAMRRLRELDS